MGRDPEFRARDGQAGCGAGDCGEPLPSLILTFGPKGGTVDGRNNRQALFVAGFVDPVRELLLAHGRRVFGRHLSSNWEACV